MQLAYDKWDYKQEGLTRAGAAIVTIIVTALTYGYGATAAGGVAASGSSTAAAAGTAATTTAAATTVSTATAMQTAALASLYSQAAVSIINNKGDVGKALKDLGTSDTVKQIVTSALTAGALNQMGADIAQLNSKVRTELFSSTGNQTIANLGGRLATNLSNAGISAGINTAVNGGSLKDNLGNAALGALVNSFQGEAASKIKTTFSDDYVAKQFAHALAGCVSGLVQGKCKDGAIGAAVGEIVADSMLGGRNPATLSDAEKHKVISYSKIIAGSVAALNGGDVNTAANAAEVAVVNNALNFDSTPTNAKKHQPQKPDKTALEKIIQGIMPAHAAGAMTNPQDKDAAIWISNIRNGITGPIVITSYGVYAAGWTAPLIGTAGKLAISTCMANPSGCTVMVTQAAEAGAGIATGAVTVGNAWEAPVGALSKAKAAKQAIPTQTVKELDGLLQESKNIGAVNTRINIANSTTRYTPMRQTGQPVSAGFEHVLEGHFHRPIANNRSVFTISPNELKVILQSNKVVSSPVSMTPDGQYMRTVDVGKVIGTTSIKEGGQPTTTIKVFTDKSGNLITTYPVKGN
ncbi:hemagglutinin [Neisseria meningitidis]|nr:pretoxin [Neisseria meningitidis]CWN22372.1 hemagglutinin [Neisseria meningitidis]CWN56404.1 hemagglutinin [Neisseria meningitidis]